MGTNMSVMQTITQSLERYQTSFNILPVFMGMLVGNSNILTQDFSSVRLLHRFIGRWTLLSNQLFGT